MESNQRSALVVFSGGLDSTTLVYDALKQFERVELISFNYGQRHKRELAFAKGTAGRLGLSHDVVDLQNLRDLLSTSGSSLVSDSPVPEGHYAADNMAQTIVPNRNMIMLSIACGVAVARGIRNVVTGVHAGDHAVYPDCRPEFIAAASYAAIEATNDAVQILAPYVNISKADIAYRALVLGVPLQYTWSCYKGGGQHCGKCGTCVERLEAIDEAQARAIADDVEFLADLTDYEDVHYWKEVVADASA